MQERIKRYYSIDDLLNDPDDKMEDRRLLELVGFISHKGVKVYLNGYSAKDELSKKGIHIINNSHVAHTFIYPNEITDDLDISKIEQEIIGFARDEKNLKVEEIKARLDYDYILEKLFKNQSILNEEILVKDSTIDCEKKIMEYVSEMNLKDKKLIITDPYIFPKNKDKNYEQLIKNILLRSKAKEIVVNIPNSKIDKDLFDSIKSYLDDNNINLILKNKENFHDRFWVCSDNKKGFVMGTSLNGIGRKICRIDNLNEEEVNVVLDELEK
ncbi:hypothetical protein C4D51_09360 [Clostridium perfringens]|nr:hypothetical protein [Clostridium perfringens]